MIAKETITNIIGSSLGGFYGLVLSDYFEDIYFHLINPSAEPHLTMASRLNENFENYVTGVKFTVTQNYINQLKEITYNLKNVEKLFIYIGLQDDILTFDKLKADYNSKIKPKPST